MAQCFKRHGDSFHIYINLKIKNNPFKGDENIKIVHSESQFTSISTGLFLGSVDLQNMSPNVRKPVFGVSTATEDGLKFRI